MKEIFDRRTNPEDFQLGDVVFPWDAPHEEKGKHGKFDHLWKGPYNISAFSEKNDYVLQEMEGGLVFGAPVNERLLKHYFLQKNLIPLSFVYTISFVLRIYFMCG